MSSDNLENPIERICHEPLCISRGCSPPTRTVKSSKTRLELWLKSLWHMHHGSTTIFQFPWSCCATGVFSPGRAEDAIDGGILRVFGFQKKNVLWKKNTTHSHSIELQHHEWDSLYGTLFTEEVKRSGVIVSGCLSGDCGSDGRAGRPLTRRSAVCFQLKSCPSVVLHVTELKRWMQLVLWSDLRV